MIYKKCMKNIRQCYFGEDRVRKVIINSFRGAIFFQRGRHVLDQQIKSNVNVYNLIFLYYNEKFSFLNYSKPRSFQKKEKKESHFNPHYFNQIDTFNISHHPQSILIRSLIVLNERFATFFSSKRERHSIIRAWTSNVNARRSWSLPSKFTPHCPLHPSIRIINESTILLPPLILRLSLKFTNRLSRISARLVNKSLDLSSNVGIGNWESLGSIRRTIIIIIVVPRNDEVPQPEQWLWIIKIIVWPTCRGVTCTVHGIFMASQKAAGESIRSNTP